MSIDWNIEPPSVSITTEVPWYVDHANIVVLARWMADNGYTAEDVAYAVEKPWKYEDEFDKAIAETNRGK